DGGDQSAAHPGAVPLCLRAGGDASRSVQRAGAQRRTGQDQLDWGRKTVPVHRLKELDPGGRQSGQSVYRYAGSQPFPVLSPWAVERDSDNRQETGGNPGLFFRTQKNASPSFLALFGEPMRIGERLNCAERLPRPALSGTNNQYHHLTGRAYGICPVQVLPDEPMNQLTTIPDLIIAGQPQASEQLLPLVYEELRKLAASRMAREWDTSTLQATALVHEAWLRLAGSEQQTWENQGHFFAAAAEAMRRILIDQARRKHTLKRQAGSHRVDLEKVDVAVQADGESLLLIDEALQKLAAQDPQCAEL